MQERKLFYMATRKRLTPEEKTTICNLYTSGKSAKDIADFLSRDKSTIWAVLRENNIAVQYPFKKENALARWQNVETRDNKQINFDDIPDLTADELEAPKATTKGDNSDLVFFCKGRHSQRPVGGFDVTITASGSKNVTARQVYFNFHNNTVNKICSPYLIPYIVFAVLGTRIYFKDENCENGYKAIKKEKSKTYYLTCAATEEIHSFIKRNTGDYNLHYDINRGLYFIDTADNKGG